MCPIRGKGVSTQANRGKYKNRSTSIVRAGFTTGGKGRYMRKEGKGGRREEEGEGKEGEEEKEKEVMKFLNAREDGFSHPQRTHWC